jgi:hypothetical protein
LTRTKYILWCYLLVFFGYWCFVLKRRKMCS